VHSAKDLPTDSDPRLVIGAFVERRDPSDALIGRRLAELAAGATVATGSVRRRAQLQRARPDLEFAELRGNIHTRLERVPADGAIVMAVAALEVLGLTDRIAERLDPVEFVPAVGQGCVALDCRVDDSATGEALARIDDGATRAAVEIERAFLARLGSGCSLPVGAHASAGQLVTFLASERSTHVVSDTIELSGDPDSDLAAAAAAADDARRRVDDVDG
jgi:hydroxymethylbilane synthase